MAALLNIQPNNITLFVSIAIAVMLLLIISFLLAFNTSQRKKFQYHQNLLNLKEEQQNELIKAAVISEETERHRISEELHDEVGALLSATRLYLFSIHPEKLQKQDGEVFNKSIELLNESIQQVRSISHNLHSGILKELGLNEAIQSFVQKLNTDKFSVVSDLDSSYDSKNSERDISIYRIIQELCGNVIKHSHATQLKILSHTESNFLIFTIRHNGNGLTQEEFERLRYEGKGLGLKNIQNRIILLKGKINFESSDNNNTVTLNVPIDVI
jgi:two-component system NarL family sensor kinase